MKLDIAKLKRLHEAAREEIETRNTGWKWLNYTTFLQANAEALFARAELVGRIARMALCRSTRKEDSQALCELIRAARKLAKEPTK